MPPPPEPLDSRTQSYLQDRVEQYRSWYDGKAVRMKKYYLRGRIAAAVGAVTVPVLNNTTLSFSVVGVSLNISSIGVTVISFLVALLIALEGVLHHREQWKNYRTSEQYLQTQRQLFLNRVGDYENLDDAAAFKLLVVRVETAIADENAVTLSVLTRAEPSTGEKTSDEGGA